MVVAGTVVVVTGTVVGATVVGATVVGATVVGDACVVTVALTDADVSVAFFASLLHATRPVANATATVIDSNERLDWERCGYMVENASSRGS